MSILYEKPGDRHHPGDFHYILEFKNEVELMIRSKWWTVAA
jgi:hypothetical protein